MDGQADGAIGSGPCKPNVCGHTAARTRSYFPHGHQRTSSLCLRWGYSTRPRPSSTPARNRALSIEDIPWTHSHFDALVSPLASPRRQANVPLSFPRSVMAAVTLLRSRPGGRQLARRGRPAPCAKRLRTGRVEVAELLVQESISPSLEADAAAPTPQQVPTAEGDPSQRAAWHPAHDRFLRVLAQRQVIIRPTMHQRRRPRADPCTPCRHARAEKPFASG